MPNDEWRMPNDIAMCYLILSDINCRISITNDRIIGHLILTSDIWQCPIANGRCVKCQMSHFKTLSNVKCQISKNNCQCDLRSDIWNLTCDNVKWQTTGANGKWIKHLSFGIVKCQMLNAKCQMLNIKCEMSNVECQMSNVKCTM